MLNNATPDFETLSALARPEKAPENGFIKLRIISPSETVVEMICEKVLLPSVNSDILILPNRAPIILILRPGRLVAWPDPKLKQPPVTYFVSKGISEIRRNLCPVLAFAVPEKNVNAAEIRRILTSAEAGILAAQSDLERQNLNEYIDFLRFVLGEIERGSDNKSTHLLNF